MAPPRCMASEMLEEETDLKMSSISSSRDFSDLLFSATVFLRSGSSMAALTFAADSRTFPELMMYEPTMTISAPYETASAAVLSFRPPATAIFMPTSERIFASVSSGLLPVICWSMPTWTFRYSTPIFSSSLARATGSFTEIRSTMTETP